MAVSTHKQNGLFERTTTNHSNNITQLLSSSERWKAVPLQAVNRINEPMRGLKYVIELAFKTIVDADKLILNDLASLRHAASNRRFKNQVCF